MRTQIFLDYVVKPSLNFLGPKFASKASLQQMLATAAVESEMGKYIKQLNGPAFGVFQIEPDTHKDVWENFIAYNPDIESKLTSMLPDNARGDGFMSMTARHNCLISNMAYSTCIARLVYYRQPDAMPSFDDKEGMWEMYKKIYNTKLGATTKDKYFEKWNRFIESVEY